MHRKFKFCAMVIAACLFAPFKSMAQSTAPPKPITHEALWMMKRVGPPALSPDGKWVVYSVLEPSYETDKSVSDLWLVPADGLKAPHRITQTKAAESDVAWSADSSSIAFVTKREGDDVEQIYVLNFAEGGEARRLTNISTGASSPKWRPDGKAILFESLVYPNAADDDANKKIAADRKAHKYNVRAYEHFPIRFWNQWLDDRQPTLMVQSIAPGSTAKDILSSTALARTSGFSGTETESSVTLCGAATDTTWCLLQRRKDGMPRTRTWGITSIAWPRMAANRQSSLPLQANITMRRSAPTASRFSSSTNYRTRRSITSLGSTR